MLGERQDLNLSMQRQGKGKELDEELSQVLLSKQMQDTSQAHLADKGAKVGRPSSCNGCNGQNIFHDLHTQHSCVDAYH